MNDADGERLLGGTRQHDGDGDLLARRRPALRMGPAFRLPKSFEASGISGGAGLMALFATHPPIPERIAALEARRPA